MPAPTSAWAMLRIVGEQPARARIFAGAEQREPEQGRADHPRGRRHQPDLDRVADQEHRREHQGDAAEPDQQPPRHQPLEQAAERFVRLGLILLDRGLGLGLPFERHRGRRLGRRGGRFEGRGPRQRGARAAFHCAELLLERLNPRLQPIIRKEQQEHAEQQQEKEKVHPGDS